MNSEQCLCDAAVGEWKCAACDLAPPAEGSSCTGKAQLACAYYDAQCTCGESPETWSCEGRCPPPVPADGVGCSEPADGVQCIYPGQQPGGGPATCVCDGNADQWRCLECPGTVPSQDDDCSGYYGRTCAYVNERCHCDTASDEWDCVACPATAPAADSDCTGFSRMLCDYAGTRCFCNGASLLWECN